MKDRPAADFKRIYELLTAAEVEFILIGGAAANLHGSPRFTLDVDVVYRRSEQNIQRLVDCLAPIHPYLRGAPPGLPFRLDRTVFRNGLNFTLTTELGDLDLLGDVAGGGAYEEMLPFVVMKSVYGLELQCINLDKLIALKRAAGRPRDTEPIAELEAIRQEDLGRPKIKSWKLKDGL
jgi:predicted nucleotidyltransferase